MAQDSNTFTNKTYATKIITKYLQFILLNGHLFLPANHLLITSMEILDIF